MKWCLIVSGAIDRKSIEPFDGIIIKKNQSIIDNIFGNLLHAALQFRWISGGFSFSECNNSGRVYTLTRYSSLTSARTKGASSSPKSRWAITTPSPLIQFGCRTSTLVQRWWARLISSPGQSARLNRIRRPPTASSTCRVLFATRSDWNYALWWERFFRQLRERIVRRSIYAMIMLILFYVALSPLREFIFTQNMGYVTETRARTWSEFSLA